MKANKGLKIVIVVFFFLLIVIIVIIGVSHQTLDNENETKSLAKMNIILNDHTLEEIHNNSKEIEYHGNKMTISEQGKMDFYENVIIKGRGNSTWEDEKKPYTIKLDSKYDLFGLGESKKWMLISNNYDDTLIRNDLGLFIARIFEEQYSFGGRFVDLSVTDMKNNETKELGVYYFLKTIDIGKMKVDLRDPRGILVELDNASCRQELMWFETASGDCMTIKDSVNKDKENETMMLFLEQYNRLEKMAKEGNFKEVERLADLESFAKYYLISDFSLNRDAYVTSFYFYKNGEKDKIHAGPVWDFDVAFGNRNLETKNDDEFFYSPRAESLMKQYVFGGEYYDENNTIVRIDPDTLTSRIIYYLIEMQDFRDIVRDVYKKYFAGNGNIIVDYVGEKVDEIRYEALKDTELWQKKDFDDAVDYLEWWVDQRIKYFDRKYGGVISVERKEVQY